MLKFRWETDFKDGEYGDIPRGWEEKTTGEVLRIEYGKGLPERDRKPGPFPVFGSSGILGYNDAAYSKGPGIIIGRKGNVGSIFLPKSDFFPIDTVFYCENLQNAAFFYYVLSRIDLKQLMSDSAVPGLNIHFLNSIKIPYPGTSEQTRIATLLSYFDELIENKKRQNEVLEATALAIFRNWFVDFEPFKDEVFVESELGEIPTGWEIRPIGELADVRNGSSYTGKEKFEDQVEGSYVFITLNNAIEGGGFKPAYAWIKSDRLKEYHFVEEGNLIIPNTEQTKDERLLGSPGIVFFPPGYLIKKGVYSHHITKISPHSEEYKLFLYFFLRVTREDSASFATGTGVLGMDIENFKKNKLVIVPPPAVLRRFHFIVEPLVQKMIVNQKLSMILRRVRDDFLPLLVFGKLRVEEV